MLLCYSKYNDQFDWAGAADGKCPCGMSGSCAKEGQVCNCDANDEVEREDSGFITNKHLLPIAAVFVGDTGMLPVLKL